MARTSTRSLRWIGTLITALLVIALAIRIKRDRRPVDRGADPAPAESFVRSLPRPKGTPLPQLFRAPRFDLAEARGQRISRASLEGTVWITNFIFTQCTSVCPVATARMVGLEARLPSQHIRFVSVSVDPEHDTPEMLRAFVVRWPEEPRWLLLAPTPAELTHFARGLRVAVVPSGDPRDPILHSRLLTLVDDRGWVRGIYDSDDERAWQQLATDADELVASLAAPVSSRTTVSRAPPLMRFGCTGCHDRPELAPPLTGGQDRVVTLVTGERIVADDPYLRESILVPAARVVKGYPPVMPSYRAMLNDREVDELVAAIRARPVAPPTNTTEAAVDPICHMQVTTIDPALTLTADGQVHHFCSAHCRDAFSARRASP